VTASTKASVKATFASGAFPTESNFTDLIDSYQDANATLTLIAGVATTAVGLVRVSAGEVVAASAGTLGLRLAAAQTSADATALLGFSTLAVQFASAVTTAAQQSRLGLTTVGVQLAAAATTAAANNALGGAPIFTRSFESSPQTITAAGALTLAHALTTTPPLVVALIRNVSAEHGYVANDTLFVNPSIHPDPGGAGATSRGLSLVADATNVNVRFGSDANPIPLLHKTTGSANSITPSNWRLIIRAWA
jgi:hypothetical protein